MVILMQENRSFDHCFGKLKGVRGFNDPRAIRLPDKMAPMDFSGKLRVKKIKTN
ncbi:MAG: alkaline phosphatase family protein [Cyclobacteriaceae bacterium]